MFQRQHLLSKIGGVKIGQLGQITATSLSSFLPIVAVLRKILGGFWYNLTSIVTSNGIFTCSQPFPEIFQLEDFCSRTNPGFPLSRFSFPFHIHPDGATSFCHSQTKMGDTRLSSSSREEVFWAKTYNWDNWEYLALANLRLVSKL